jgi:uncharacterized protein
MPVADAPANFGVDLRAASGCGAWHRTATNCGILVVRPWLHRRRSLRSEIRMAPDDSHDRCAGSMLRVRVVGDLSGVDPAEWNGLDHGASPFLEYGFLRALESSGSMGTSSGWNPSYLLVEAQPAQSGGSAQGAGSVCVAGSSQPTPKPRLRAAVACFTKEHSYGEYIFDFAWARASMRAGLPYYPKLVIAAPMTPATGRRILVAPDVDAAEHEEIVALVCDAVRELADSRHCSSIHWLFTTEDEQRLLERQGFLPRASFQFHWRNEGYADFEAFLGALSSRKRKQIRKERRRAQAAVDDIEWIDGTQMTAADVAALDGFYRSTTARHGGQCYLRRGFFERLVELLPHRLRFVRALRDGRTIAGAIYLETSGALYGRYWGCAEEVELLHFELAYYQGIERCIREGLALFEAGAQGEHKLLRGFRPAYTYSSHWIRHPGLRDGVRRFLEEEAAAVRTYMAELDGFAPYRRPRDP